MGSRKPLSLNRTAKIGYGHICPSRENLSFDNNYMIWNWGSVNESNPVFFIQTVAPIYFVPTLVVGKAYIYAKQQYKHCSFKEFRTLCLIAKRPVRTNPYTQIIITVLYRPTFKHSIKPKYSQNALHHMRRRKDTIVREKKWKTSKSIQKKPIQ